jgi:hypothetical protein
VGPASPFVKLPKWASARIVADENPAAGSIDSGCWSRREIRWCGKLKMVSIEALPEKIIIQTKH